MIALYVPSVPVAQPRPRAVIAHGGKGARIHEVTHIKNPNTGERKPHPIAAFKATIRMKIEQVYTGPPLQGPLCFHALFLMPRPGRLIWKSRPMPRLLHESKPDLDNLEKSTMDAIKGLLWTDDSQVAFKIGGKYYAAGDEAPGVHIQVGSPQEFNGLVLNTAE